VEEEHNGESEKKLGNDWGSKDRKGYCLLVGERGKIRCKHKHRKTQATYQDAHTERNQPERGEILVILQGFAKHLSYGKKKGAVMTANERIEGRTKTTEIPRKLHQRVVRGSDEIGHDQN